MTITGFTVLHHAVWSGTLGATEEEIFSYGRYYASLDADADAVIADSLANDVADMLAESTTGSTPFSNLGQIFPTTVHWTLLKLYSINESTGAIVGEPEVRVLDDVGLGAAGQGLPYQDALAITYTNLPTNRTSRNRFYLPPFVSTATDGHGRVLGTLIDDIQTQLQFAKTAHLAEDFPFTPCVYSTTEHNAKTLDRWMTGDVMDTIRRRRNKLPESRHVLAA
jgi:hypothetical protein